MPTIDLPDDELAAVAAAIRRAIEDDRYPHAPRLDPLRAALGKFDAALKQETTADSAQVSGPPKPRAPPPAKADKRARRRSPPSFVHRSGPCHHEFNVAG
jgi:hypothetical protein